MRGLCHVFSWLTQCNQAFPLAECSEENPVPYRAGNRDHGVTDGTRNHRSHRGNTDALRRVRYSRSTAPVNCSRACPRTDSVHSSSCRRVIRGLAAWSGSAVMSALTSVSSSQPVRADTATTGCTGRQQPEYRICFLTNVLFLRGSKAEYLPYPIHGRAPFCRPASPQTAPADVPGAGCVARNSHPQTGPGHRVLPATVPGQVQAETPTVQGFILCIPVPALAHPGQVSDNHAVTMALRRKAALPGAGANITDRGDLPLNSALQSEDLPARFFP